MNDLFAALKKGFVEELSRTVERNPFLENDLARLTEEQGLEAGREGAQAALAPFIWSHAVGDLWDDRRVTEFLDTTRHAVYKLLEHGSILGLDGRGTTWFPTWQFDTELRIVRPVTQSIIKAFHDADPKLDPLTIAAWVMAPCRWLEGTSPADWLSEGRDESRVVLAAQRSAAPLSA